LPQKLEKAALYALKLFSYCKSDCSKCVLLFPNFWHIILRSYTRAKLTFQKDKLVALPGIASAVQHYSDFVYLAGLWKETFLMDSLWICKKPGTRPQNWRASTWSWASLDTADEIHNLWFAENWWKPAAMRPVAETLDFEIDTVPDQVLDR
ncbi:hypothetical protein H2199_003435, partial [Coniosporium tulheliwenetii]